jgi:hypothetical protein
VSTSRSRVSRLLGALAVALVGLSLLRCGQPDTCLRFSDCSPGFTCFLSRCVPQGDLGAVGEGGAAQESGAGSVDATAADAPGEAAPTTDAATAPAGDADTVGDADAGDPDVDPSDF